MQINDLGTFSAKFPARKWQKRWPFPTEFAEKLTSEWVGRHNPIKIKYLPLGWPRNLNATCRSNRLRLSRKRAYDALLDWGTRDEVDAHVL